MTFGVIKKGEPFLAELIAIAFESAGHDCLVLKSIDHATRVLQSTQLDSIVLHLQMPGRSGLDWMESMVTTWPDLPSRTLLLTNAALTPDEAARIDKLGAEVIFRPSSLVGIELVVLWRLQRARLARASRLERTLEETTPAELLN